MNSLQNAPYQPTDAPVRVVFEDDDLAVVVKPANLLTVPGRGPEKRDCAEQRLKDQGRAFVRAAHRLDQDTSGLIIFGLSPRGHRAANMMFEARSVQKRYVALCHGTVPTDQDTWLIDLPLLLDWPNRPKHQVNFEAGKPSQTEVSLVEQLAEMCRLDLRPITGRSHQLRVHLAHTGLPICGDPLYGSEGFDGYDRLHLHACHLAFDHPLTGEPLCFDDPAPF